MISLIENRKRFSNLYSDFDPNKNENAAQSEINNEHEKTLYFLQYLLRSGNI